MSQTAIARREPAPVYSAQQQNLIKQTLMPQASDAELAVFIEYARRTRLDPFARQIYAIPVWDKDSNGYRYQFTTGIDGLRLVAERTGEYQGSDGPFWCDSDLKWTEVWPDDEFPPYAAKVTVHRLGRRPVSRIVKYREFARTDRQGSPIGKWLTMPAHMLGVRAESHALRAAFPRETSGLYVDDAIEVINPEAEASNAQKGELVRLARLMDWDDAERRERAGVASFTELTKGQANRLITDWRELAEGVAEREPPDDLDTPPVGDEVEPEDLDVDVDEPEDVEPEAPATQGARTAAASGSTFDADGPASAEQITRLVGLFGGGQAGGNKALRFARTLLGDAVSSLEDLNADQAAALIMRRAGGSTA